jgi:hypothetical protein
MAFGPRVLPARSLIATLIATTRFDASIRFPSGAAFIEDVSPSCGTEC